MSDQSLILLAIGGLVLGLALSAGGTYLLGNARAVARYSGTERRRRADVGQYVAAFGALTGFVLVAGGAAVIVSELMPASDAVRLVGGAVAGVLAFAAAGVSFSRVADASESARVQRMPTPAYVPAPPTTPPTLPPGLTVPSAPPARAPTSAPPVLAAPVAPERPAAVYQSASASPAQLVSAQPTTSGTVSSSDAADGAAGYISGAGRRALDGAQSAADPSGASIDRALAAAPGDEDAAAGSDGTGGPTAPIVLEHVTDADELMKSVRPGWIYRDEADGWYLGVGEGGAAGPLLRLPEFRRAPADEPAYPLLVVGAGEIAVVPVPTPASLEAAADHPS